jgi:hypothetical protein
MQLGIYDLAATLDAIDDAGFAFETASMRANTFIEFGRGTRPVKVCQALDRQMLWQRPSGTIPAGNREPVTNRRPATR